MSGKLSKVLAFACVFGVATALGAGGDGDIMSVEVLSGYPYSLDNGMRTYPNDGQGLHSTPHVIGEKVTLRFRLLNADRGERTQAYPWTFAFAGGGSLALAGTDWFGPKIGLSVGGVPRYANVISCEAPAANARGSQRLFTDLICQYTVQPGDLGQPVKLLNRNGREISGDDSTGFCLQLPTGWSLENMRDPADAEDVRYDCDFRFSSDRGLAAYTEKLPPAGDNETGVPAPLVIDGSELGVYVKTIDFDSDYALPDEADPANAVWRVFYEGSTKTTKSGAPTVRVDAKAEYGAGGYATMWVWSEDDTIVVPVGALRTFNVDGRDRKALELKVSTGDEIVPFSLKAVGTKDQTCRIYMSSAPTNIWNVAGGDVSCVVSRLVKIGERLKPSVSVAFRDGKGEMTATADYLDQVPHELIVTLSETFTNDVTVKVVPVLKAGPDNAQTNVDVFANHILAMSDLAGDPVGWNKATNTVTFLKDTETEKSLFVYPLGATKNSVRNGGTGIEFRLEIAEADARAFFADRLPTTGFVKGEAATIRDPAEGQMLNFTAKHATKVEIELTDGCRNLLHTAEGDTVTMSGTNRYTVVWNRNDNTSTQEMTFKGLKPELSNGRYVLTVEGVTYPNESETPYESNIRVVNPDGLPSYVTVKAAVTVANQVKCAFDREDRTYAEGTVANILVSLSKRDGETLYAFLRPIDADASNKVAGAQLLVGDLTAKKGVEIPGSGTVAAKPIAVTVLDGDCDPHFQVVLCSTQTYAADKVVDRFDTSDPVGFTGTNVLPTGAKMRIGGTSFDNGERMGYPVPADNAVSLGVEIDDVVADLKLGSDDFDLAWWANCVGGAPASLSALEAAHPEATNGLFVTKWEIYNSKGKKVDTLITVGTKDQQASTNYTFTSIGDNQVRVQMLDKDAIRALVDAGTDLSSIARWSGGVAYGDENGYWTSSLKESQWGPATVVTVPVSDKAHVEISMIGTSSYYSSGEVSFGETLEYSSGFRIGVSEEPPVPITVRVWVERVASTNGQTDVMRLGKLVVNGIDLSQSTNNYIDVAIKRGQQLTDTRLLIEDTDGTRFARYKLHAKVITTTKNDDDIKMCDFYDETAQDFTIDNVAPVLGSVSSNMGMEFRYTPQRESSSYYYRALEYTNVIEIAQNYDLTIDWTAEDIEADATNGLKVTWSSTEPGSTLTVSNRTSGTYVTRFTSAGAKSVTCTVTDKDGGSVGQYSWAFKATASKRVYVYPHGPHPSGLNTLAQKYLAAGIGVGYAEADGSFGGYANFRHSWDYPVEKNTATIYARGLRAHDADTNLLQSASRVWMTANGTNTTDAAQALVNDSDYDSFVYAFVQQTAGDGGNFEVGAVNLKPQLGNVLVENPVPLPVPEKDAVSYVDRYVEIVFSREYLRTDNLGDINLDGIPDAYVVGGPDLGVVSAGDTSGADLKDLTKHNDDGDFLPLTESTVYTQWIPEPYGDWTLNGRPFYAKDELRGFGEALNDALEPLLLDAHGARTVMNKCSIKGATPDRVYLDPDTCPTSTLSKVEFLAFVEQGGLTNDVATWATWSPERPTDPTLNDTDGDGLEDGYEYFIWYRAHVGSLKNGRLVHLTGRRYDPLDPASTNVITSLEIEQAFDPLVSAGDNALLRDFDNDGLTDVEEFALGTNPFNCDTDGDGLPDGYEVAISGTDPLLWATDKSTCDADLNPDGDWMANEKVEKQQVFGLDDGNGGVDYYSFGQKGPGDPDRVEAIEGRVTFLMRRDQEGKVDTNSFWVTTQEVCCRTNVVDGTNYCYLTRALTAKGTWKASYRKLETTANLVACGQSVDLPVGWFFSELKATNDGGGALQAFNVYYSFPDDEVRYWRVWHYGRDLTVDKDEKKRSNLVFGKEYNHASRQNLGKRAVRVMPFEKTVHRLHYHVYQDGGYDPRTAWKGKDAVKTTAFTHLDEFYTLAYFYNDGVLGAAELVPTRENPWPVLWEKYSTSPLSADTDEDAMPDGWELYMLGGPKQYVEKPDDPNYHERIVDYGPRWKYSPLISFNLLTDPNDRDNDKDKLEWPDEYMGVESGAQYPDCATIAAPYETWKARGWHNKKWPTDPWNEDTDGDGLTDGEEEAKVFIYGDPGATGTAGGGLNPLSWDTDGDFLPDPWELEFAGHYEPGASTNKTEVAVSEDKSSTNTVTTTLTAPGDWVGGMNGTVADAFLDYDYDGLDNWQEYMTGAMRCWRYDDTVSPWTNLDDPFFSIPSPLDEEAWNDFWYQTLVDEQSAAYNPHFVGGTYDNGASWFSQCTNEWDSAHGFFFMFKDGVYHDLRLPPARYIVGEGDDKLIFNRFTWRVYELVGDFATYFINGVNGDYRVYPIRYVCCDPTMHDTDLDGMDDYYELFHGLNPLLGQNRGDYGSPRPPQDVVYRSYGGDGRPELPPFWSAQNNFWYNDAGNERPCRMAHAKPRTKGNSMDFEIFPWLNGLAHADPDGDNIPNQQEAILPNVQAAASYLHTDPSPLWMTDSTWGDSLTCRYFRDPASAAWQIDCPVDGFFHVDPLTGKTNEYKFADFPLFSYNAEKQLLSKEFYSLSEDMWDAMDYFWSFEENEGYDSDHDYLSDFEEAQGKTKPASDPQNSDDPLRRQAMYFGGAANPGFLQTPLAHAEQVPYSDDGSEARQNFLYYTAECWVKAEDVRPDGDLQTILERVIQCTSENPADERLTRRNFLLGVKNGRWYTKFDSTGTDANQPVEITDGPQATTNWTHLAATYDGEALRLYVDGVCNNSKQTSIQPEHGITAAVVNDSAELITTSGQSGTTYDNRSWPLISLIVGASATGAHGVVIDYNPRVDPMARATTVADYTSFFKGYVDEIRLWDGARPASDIRSDYQQKTRYNAALAAENRQVVYSAWRTGARRSPVNPAQLPAQLMYHFTFDHLPGAVNASDVLRSPAGFVTAPSVTDAKAIWSRPENWVQPWWCWTLASLRSKVYAKEDRDCAWVPWIANTVAHLPRFDGGTLDSVYWSESYAGSMSAAEAGYQRFSFPNNHEVYSRWCQMIYNTSGAPWSMHSHSDFLRTIDGDDSELMAAYRFSMRDRKTVGDDLLPMLGAYPRRISAAEGGMWDGEGAADAWAQTGQDSDNNSLPDWWQRYARANYGTGMDPRQALTWDTTVTYKGVLMPAWQAYLRDLAAGMLPGGKVDENYVDTRDFDKDGMPDWWEEQNSVQGYSQADADADPDNDGLSNYAEYLLGEVYPYAYGLPALDPEGYKQPKLDPQHAFSTVGQRVVDYFQSFSTNHVKVTTGTKTHFWLNEYFGEIATDHDFMEDWWENVFKGDYASSKVYDPLDDADEDGWSNWAECRASLWGGYFNAALIDSWTGSDSSQHVVCYPEPILGVRATYHGLQDISGHQLVIRTLTGQTPRVDATFVVPSEASGQTRYIGPFRGDYAFHGHLSPGQLNANSIVFERAQTSSDKNYTWNFDWYIENEDWSEKNRTRTGTFEQYRSDFARWPKIELEGGDLVWESFATAQELTPGTATVMLNSVAFGTVDCTTGEFELDMAKFDTDVSTYVFRVTYTSRIGHEWPQTVYVSDTKELANGAGTGGLGSGRMREGRTTVEAFLDLNGDGLYTAGEPFGTARNVQVGWHKVPTVTIELKDVSPIMPCVTLGDVDGDTDGDTDGDAAATLTKRIRIVRETVNGLSELNGERLKERTLLTKEVVLDDHPYLTEADVCTSAKPDLDWMWLLRDAAKIGLAASDVAFAGYRVDEVVKLADGSVTNIQLATFSKEFPGARPTATPVGPIDGAPVYSASPKLSFSISDAKATGCRLQIRRRGSTELTYDSGVTMLPGRTGSTVGAAVCELTPPVYADAPVYAGITTNRAVFADGSNYQWRVALYDAKYNATVDDSDSSAEWSKWANFELDVANESRYPRLPTGFGAATVAVRYFGPMTNDLSGKIVVEAFESADFRGQPLAQVRVSDLGDLRSLSEVGAGNAVLRGIRPGKVFLRAYVDQNDNGSRDKWESWGYANMVGKGFKAIYNPDPYEVTVSTADWIVGDKADVVVYVEDCDVNKNEEPDCLEPDLFPVTASEEQEEEDVTDPKLDTDGDGMPDVWENWNDGFTDPMLPDGDLAEAGDVMAYLDETRTLVTFDDGTQLLLAHGQTYAKSENRKANAYVYDSWYRYGGDDSEIYGVGTNVTVSSATLEIMKDEQVTVRLVHAQVYARKGYNGLTANPTALAAGTAVDTKPFTALDKLMVLRYLQAIGATPANPNAEKYKDYEEYVRLNGSSVWKQWTLLPGEPDMNGDKVADGWQLYVMYGDALGGTGALPATFETPVTPWTAIGATRALSPGGEGLSWSQEYDGGRYPTDPWSVDSDGDGIPDNLAYAYGLKGERYREDDDNDGLSNFQEFLSSVALTNALKTPVVSPSRRMTYAQDGQAVPDYFLRVGSLYLGEILADHDFIEDWLEDSDVLFVGDRRASRYQYDAHLDADGNGWDNWSEARAYLATPTNHVFMGVKTNIVTQTDIATEDEAMQLYAQHDDGGLGDQSGSLIYWYTDEKGETKWAVSWREFEDVYRDVVDYAGRPQPSGRIRVVYNGERNYAGNLVIQAYRYRSGQIPPLTVAADATWVLPVQTKNAWYELSASTNGYVCGGKNMFVVYDDADADGAWTPGEPYGIVTDVDVGYHTIADSTVELTDVNSSVMRIDLAKAAGANDFATQKDLNDRGVNPSGVTIPNSAVYSESYSNVFEQSGYVRVRVVRLSVNDKTSMSYYKETYYALDTILDMHVDATHTGFLTEWALLGAGQPDLDWGNVKIIGKNLGFGEDAASVGKVTYGIVLGDADIRNSQAASKLNVLATTFSNAFEPLAEQTLATPRDIEFSQNGNCPTFSWTHEQRIKRYPAFRLRIWDGTKAVYDSGVQRAPLCDGEGVYRWTAPASAGGKLESGKDYKFTVSMLDAKFSTPNAKETKSAAFRTQANGLGGDLSDQYSIFAAVKYFGPVVYSNKEIRVEAFASPDFVGQPEAVTTVKNCDDLASTNSLSFNAMLVGLAAGKDYYVRAFIDSNTNGVKDASESWGYGNYVGTNRRDIYTPRAYVAKKGSFQMPEAVVYIEDVDRDNNGLPDARTDLTVTPTNSPYVVTYEGGEASPVATNLFAAMGDGVLRLPFVSQLHTLENGGKLSALQLCYAMAQGEVPSVETLKTESRVRVTSFSPVEGIGGLEISTPTTIDGKTLLPKVSGLSYSVKLQVKVWHVNELTGTWAEVTPQMDPIEVPVNAVDETIAPDKLNQINTQVRALATEASGFYKVEVEVVP